jgi:hypothetical protein
MLYNFFAIIYSTMAVTSVDILRKCTNNGKNSVKICNLDTCVQLYNFLNNSATNSLTSIKMLRKYVNSGVNYAKVWSIKLTPVAVVIKINII